MPVATSPEGAFGDADTIIERLNDAQFDREGVARVKVIVRALHFRASEPLKTGCGDWSAEVGLDRRQVPTDMTIVRESERGGYFTAPISVDAQWTFTRGSGEEVRTLSTSNLMLSDERTPWQSQVCTKAASAVAAGSILVDTNNDGRAELKVAARTNSFNPGWTSQCIPYSPCRAKGLDPGIHCYEPTL